MILEGVAFFQRRPSSIGGATATQAPVNIIIFSKLAVSYVIWYRFVSRSVTVSQQVTAVYTLTLYIQRPSREGILHALLEQQDRARGNSKSLTCSATTLSFVLISARYAILVTAVFAAWEAKGASKAPSCGYVCATECNS